MKNIEHRINNKIDKPAKVVYKTNRVQMLAPIGRLIVRPDQTVSGKGYEWIGCGSIIEVDERDVPGIFRIRSGFQPCPSCHDGDSNMFMVLD